MGTKSSIYLTDTLRQKLKTPPFGSRGLSESVSLIINRYFDIMRFAVRDIKELFTADELQECINICISTDFKNSTADAVLINVEDTLENECLFPENKAALENKLRKLSVLHQYALIELIETTREKITEKTATLKE